MEISFERLSISDLVPGYIYKSGDSKKYFNNEVVSKIFQFPDVKGIGNQSGIRRTMIEKNTEYKNEEAFIVLINTKKDSDWRNSYDTDTRTLTYYGDNKNPDKDYLNTKQKGNYVLEKYFQRTYSDIPNVHIAPFFYFERENGLDIRYIGLAIPFVENKKLDDVLKIKDFPAHNKRKFKNLEAKFTILTDVTIKREWLYDLKIGKKNSVFMPDDWGDFLSSKTIHLSNNKYEAIDVLDTNLDHVGYGMTKYRRTQKLFRKALIERENKCQLCNIDIPELLVASHILPWSVSDNYQKNNTDNGLLLCITHDGLFDKGLISFDENGRIIVSDVLRKELYGTLNICENMKIQITDKSEQYMKIHRLNLQSFK
ncbi:HNH endonuclease [Metabacillus indicus]|uniref:HNH endonuclease n=1 Tax=Metabacillus indicus TaxID=246786 RepID=UPI002A007C43|nr:HNH endonuclease [Metabacillus indicus]MDX8289118.1 HNH endonuclease [Metabacillus indicus]